MQWKVFCVCEGRDWAMKLRAIHSHSSVCGWSISKQESECDKGCYLGRAQLPIPMKPINRSVHLTVTPALARGHRDNDVCKISCAGRSDSSTIMPYLAPRARGTARQLCPQMTRRSPAPSRKTHTTDALLTAYPASRSDDSLLHHQRYHILLLLKRVLRLNGDTGLSTAVKGTIALWPSVRPSSTSLRFCACCRDRRSISRPISPALPSRCSSKYVPG
eukprot:COSAG05_NODE_352_length_10911_cov_31.817139_3_plen_218_part_00